jgi:hypothetical protein
MKTLEVKKEQFGSYYPDPDIVSSRLDLSVSEQKIEKINWPVFSYKPDVRFRIAYSDYAIFLKYYVREDFVKAEKTSSNEMVCEDSCVEFFVSPSDDGIYYNFEFNPIGTCLLASGSSRHDRKKAPVSVIETIKRKGTFGLSPFKEITGDQSWTLTVVIPFEAFFRHRISSPEGTQFQANFYKCGDKLTQPHYLTWNPVGTKSPDYHQPGFFGLLRFVR